MDFILKPDLLPIYSDESQSLQPNAHLFYDFQAKKQREKQLQEERKMEELLQKIREEEERRDRKRNIKHLLNLPDTSQASIKKHYQDFYQKNKRWKENLERQIFHKQQEKRRQQQKIQQQSCIPLAERSEEWTNRQNQYQSGESLELYKGPISNWHERFHQYVKNRLPQEPTTEGFIPMINKKSKIIASKMVGRVQDRLIRYGEVMKIKRHQMAIQELQKVGKLPEDFQSQYSGSTEFNFRQIHHSVSSTDKSKDDFFNRLYKEAEVSQRRQNSYQHQSQFPFKPTINNNLPNDLQRRVNERRESNPLYSVKKLTSTRQRSEANRIMTDLAEGKQKQSKGKGGKQVLNQADFQNFLKRNEQLIEKRQQNQTQKRHEEFQKYQKDLQKCTFIPTLNPKSLRLFEQSKDTPSKNKASVPMQVESRRDNSQAYDQEYQDQTYSYSPDQELNREEDDRVEIEQSPSHFFSNIQAMSESARKHRRHMGSISKNSMSLSLDESAIQVQQHQHSDFMQPQLPTEREKSKNQMTPESKRKRNTNLSKLQHSRQSEFEQPSQASYMDSLELVGKRQASPFQGNKNVIMSDTPLYDQSVELTYSNTQRGRSQIQKKELQIITLNRSPKQGESIYSSVSNSSQSGTKNKPQWEKDLDSIKSRLKGLIRD